jgi:RNA polymerase sigma factor (sigma-70 family)
MASLRSKPPLEFTPELIAGGEAAFNELYSYWFKHVDAFASSRLPTKEDGEDVAQRVFMRLHRRLQSAGIEPGRKVKPYLMQIAANEIRRFYTEAKPLDELPYGFEHNTPSGDEPMDDYLVRLDEMNTILTQLSVFLTPRELQLTRLIIYEGISIKEASKRLGFNYISVWNTFSSAKSKIGAWLAARGGNPQAGDSSVPDDSSLRGATD